MRRLLLSAILLCFVNISAQTLYSSGAFSVTNNKIVQGKFYAEALSPKELRTNYRSSYSVKVPNFINFKFSINGTDNENDYGKDHKLYLNPEGGKIVSPVYKFGEALPQDTAIKETESLTNDAELTFRLNINDVLNSFKEKGYYTLFNGSKITKDEFKGVFIAGNTFPLDWDFNTLGTREDKMLKDPDGDGIYELTLKFSRLSFPGAKKDSVTAWKLSRDISSYPQFSSGQVIADALYNQALEEMLLDIQQDGTFQAGEKWPGVWTRDVSYSIILALAIAKPDAAMASLRAKVKNGRIIQDTGTGGSYPVSSDRMIWAVAAYEIYKTTGDEEWLKESFEVIKNSFEDDLKNIYDPETGLMKGESSFLDWREQTYPLWMQPVDIYNSECLSTNAVHYRTAHVLTEMADILGKPSAIYKSTADKIKAGINKYLWSDENGYYGQYLYGRGYYTLSKRAEALGEALTILFDITDKDFLSNIPLQEYGIPTIYPQIPGINPYHNNSVWPFVQAYYGWAAAKEKNVNAVEYSLAQVYRAAGMFGTNQENYVASTGDYLGTEINSPRQLWSVAGNLAMVYRVLFGISFEKDKMIFNPVVPEDYTGAKQLTNFKYGGAVFDIELEGTGCEVEKFYMDGKLRKDNSVPIGLTGKHNIKIIMKAGCPGSGIKIVENKYSLPAPVVKKDSATLSWNKIDGANIYYIYINGVKADSTDNAAYTISLSGGYEEYSVSACRGGVESFTSEPVESSAPVIIEAETGYTALNGYEGFSGKGYIQATKEDNTSLTYTFDAAETGEYIISLRYSNNNGPINTDNKCAIRTLAVNNKFAGKIIMPQRGTNLKREWGITNMQKVTLNKGRNEIKIEFTPSDNNMNFEVNSAMIDYISITPLKKIK